MKNVAHGRFGFSLIEVTLALGVAAFALLAIFGLLPVGLNNNQTSIQQSTATNIATGIVADLRETPAAAAIAANSALTPKSSKYGIDVTSTGTTCYLDESGALQASAGTSRFKAIVSLIQPPVSAQRAATTGSITLSWPASAKTPLGSVVTFVALDRN